MSTVSPHQSTLLCGQGFDVSTIRPKPFSCEYFTIIGAIFCRMRLAISCCWLPKSSCASCTARSKVFCLPSICFFRVARASSFSLSCCVVSCFFKLSSSSFWLFSSVCLGSNFLPSASMSRRPSLLPKMASLMLMVPTLVPVLAPVVVAGVAEAGLVGAAVAPDGVAALPVWASAEIPRETATARKNRKYLLVIGSLELLGTCLSEHGSGNELRDRSL